MSRDIPYDASLFLPNSIGAINEIRDETTIDRWLGDAYAEYDLLESLQLRTTFGVDIEDITREYVEGKGFLLQAGGRGAGYARTHRHKETSLLSETTLKYNDTLGENENHDFDITTGFTWESKKKRTLSISKTEALPSVKNYSARASVLELSKVART